MFRRIVIVCVLLMIVAGCIEDKKVVTPSQEIKPLDQQILSARDDWKGAYGDDFETQATYNLAILHLNQAQIINAISQYHPAPDPNAPVIDSNEATE